MQTKPAPQVVTLRNIPPRLAGLLRQKADADGLSLNNDLDDLIGSWSESEAAEFDEALREQRTIDEEMWK